MKKTILIAIICASISALVSFLIFTNITSQKVYIKKLEGNYFQLIVNNKPYIVKGVVYNPIPIGYNHTYDFWSDPKKLHLYDASLMKEMGVNTIRVYQPGKDPEKTKELIRDFYKKFNIRVAMGHWLGFWDSPNYAAPVFREKVKEDVLTMVRTYKDEDGIIFWILGNENNVSFYQGHQSMNFWTTNEIESLKDPLLKRKERARIYYSFVNDIAKEIKKLDTKRLVVLANKELSDIDVAANLTPDIDMLGCSVYRGKTFGNFFREAANIFKKPVLLTEFGCDRYNAFLNKEDQLIQKEFLQAQWNEIKNNSFEGSRYGNCLGGFIFEWTDEWWKFNEDNKPGWIVHDRDASWSNGSYYFDIKADRNFNINEEWWGLCAVEKREGALDERKPSKAYFLLKELWQY